MEKRIITTDVTEEDFSLEGNLRPQTLDDYIGQEKTKNTLKVYIEAAKQRHDALDHVLFYGPPGLGKTTLSGIIANEMGVHMKVTSGPAIEKPGEMAAILNNLQEGDILFVDEIHRLNRQVEEVLYPAMEDYVIDIMIGKGPGARSVRLNLPKFTLVGATTRAGMLTAPLRDRFGVVNRLEFYTDEELKVIVERSAELLGVKIDEAGAMEVIFKLLSISFAIIPANVVFPRPGGPYNNTWSRDSPRILAASINTRRFFFTFSCPIYSDKFCGRRLPSTAISSSISSVLIILSMLSPYKNVNTFFNASFNNCSASNFSASGTLCTARYASPFE